MFREGKAKRFLRRRVRLGRWSVSAGALIIAGVVLLAGGGVVYARLGGSANDPSTTVNLQKGLIGWWKLDGNAVDNTPYAANGTLANAPTATTDREGGSNKAMAFNGLNSHITVPDRAALKYTGGDYSISAWFNANTTETTGGYIVSKAWNGSGGYNYRLQYTGSGVQVLLMGASSYALPSVAVARGGWHLATVVLGSDSSVKLYIDGQLAQSGTSTITDWTIADLNRPLAIGTMYPYGQGWAGSTGHAFDGMIDDVRLYDRQLSSSEAAALYQQYDAQLNAGSGESGLLGWWKLDGNAKDATPYANNGTFTAGTAIADRKGSAGSAYSFNASGSKMVLPNPVGQSGLMTASVWYRRNDAASASSNWRTILGHKTANIHPLIVRITTNTLCIFDGATRDFGYTVPNDNTWHNYTVIYNSTGTARLYVDGIFVNQITTTLNLGTNPIGTIGNWNSGNYWAGDIDDVRLYNRALSDTEIQRLFSSYNSQINLNSTPSRSTTSNVYSGMIGYWPFSGNAKDATPYANNGTVNGATLTTDRKGNATSAYQFNGTSNNITANLVSAITKAGTYTVSVWVKSTNTGSSQTVFQNAADCSDRNSMAVNGTAVYFYYYNGTAYVSKAGTSMLAGQWNHLVGVNSGGTLSLYINGVAQSGTGNAYAHCQVGLWLGSTSAPGTPQWYNGSMDEFRVWNRALSAAEVQALYAQ